MSRPPDHDRSLRLPSILVALGAERGSPEPAARKLAHVTVADITRHSDDAGFGMLLAVLTLIAIPFVGLSTPFGIAVVILGAQLMVGRTAPWLPGWISRRHIPLSMLDRVLVSVDKRAAWLARVSRPRWLALSRGVLRPSIGFGLMILGAGLALPLPIPGSNLIFLIPIFIYAIGLMENDGAWIAAGHALMIVDVVLLVVFGQVVLMALEAASHKVGC